MKIPFKYETVAVERLPPELLGIIFKYLHDDIRDSTDAFEASLQRPSSPDVSTCAVDLPLDAAALRDDQRHEVISLARSPGFFPYNCAGVCSMWQNVVFSYPVFWTRMVFFIDSHPTSSDDADLQIRRSRDLPFDVIITYRTELPPATDEEQKLRIDNLIKLLLPHIGRCRMLHVDAFSSSSLPSFEFDDGRRYDADILADISLTCELDSQNSVSDFAYCTHALYREDLPFSCNSVRSVMIDGVTFRRACLSDSHWLHMLTKLEQLCISETKFLPGSHLFERVPDPDAHQVSLLAALEFIESTSEELGYLKLQNIHFDAENLPSLLIYHYSLPQLRVLCLDNISPSSMKQLFCFCDFPRLSILHLNDFSQLDHTIFSDMSIDVAALFLSLINQKVDLAEFLDRWYGHGLCLIKCFWMSDSLLRKFSETRELEEGEQPPEGGKRFLCPNMSVFFLILCPVFSIEPVKKLVEARNHYVDYTDPEWRTKTIFGPALRTLVIKNVVGKSIDSRPLSLSEGDERWFKERLVDFTWEY